MAAEYSILWIYYNLFNQSPTNEHLDILFNMLLQKGWNK